MREPGLDGADEHGLDQEHLEQRLLGLDDRSKDGVEYRERSDELE